MKTASDRINARMKELGLKPADLVRGTGAGRATVSAWTNDGNNPSAKYLDSLAKCLKTTPSWILTGEGEKETKAELQSEPVYSNVKTSSRQLRKIPLLDFVQAGMWREVVYDGLNPLGESYTSYVGSDPHSVFSLEVDGYSMSPEYMPGDVVVVDAALAPKPGALVIAQEIQQGVAVTTFKKYKVLGINEYGVEIIELKPLNDDYPTYNSTQIEISIIGVVIEHHKRIRY
ncbi:helix-turn-helix domain-containing protein [Acinetobacter baumannii]|uniref:LexA family protein n=1 Tax=Acinetobacter baumannii TaxID=470 RepID=UPI0007A387F0|nr:S24 family peptidase [Acinetobacter baumannii]EHU1763502.1 helix-turn-helix domain-containing protein [Acinetobacter baumannii]EHU1766378.1 helix-turn-helix domain-containing protein [Acinetobacter baumannii]EHU2662269.1 helix-turn-helix domain-containing protein [Acinetobacter baumannii]EHU2902700.1 helix-turn-helix domain-containing protein [Acinetobacter baumannii]EHU2905361.1 helix-turn-helix domain-containing protein [Acinetobacter baumannii]